MERMEWALNLDDEISAPGKKMQGALEGVDRKLKTAGETSDRTSRLMARGAREAAEAHSFLAMQLDAVMNIAGRVGGFLERVFAKAYNFGEFAVQAAAFKENALIAFEAIAGSKRAAQEIVKETVADAAKTPFETRDMIRWRKELMVGGFGKEESRSLTHTLTEVGAFNEMRTDVVDRLASSLAKLRGEGHLTGDTLQSLASAGVQPIRVFEQLGKLMNFALPSNPIARSIVMEKILPMVDAATAVKAIEGAVQGIGGGHMMERASRSVTGLLSTVASRPFELMMDLDFTQGYASLKDFLGRLAHMFDPTGESGKSIQGALLRTLSDAFTAIFGDLSKLSETSLVEGVTKGLDVISSMGRVVFAGVGAAIEGALGSGLWERLTGPDKQKALEELTTSAREFGSTLGRLASNMDTLFGASVKVLDVMVKLGSVWENLQGWGALPRLIFGDNERAALTPEARARDERGKRIRDDIEGLNNEGTSSATRAAREERIKRTIRAEGENADAAGLSQAELDRRTGTPASFRTPAFENGPDAAVDRLAPSGGYDAGVAVGKDIEEGARAALDLHSPSRVFEEIGHYSAAGFQQGFDVQAPAVARGGGGGIQVPISIVQHITGGKDVREMAAEVLERLRAELPSTVMAALEQLSLEAGGG